MQTINMSEKIVRQEVTEKIELKMLTTSNASDYFRLIDNNRKYFGNFNNLDQSKYQSVQEVEASLKSADKIRYGIYCGDNLVGTINLQNIAEQEGGGRNRIFSCRKIYWTKYSYQSLDGNCEIR